MTKYMEINGEIFEVIKPRKRYLKEAIERLAREPRKDLYSHYEKPSKVKIGIWNAWVDWALESPVDCITVTSASTFQFTISAILYDPETDADLGLIRITKCHNRVYLL